MRLGRRSLPGYRHWNRSYPGDWTTESEAFTQALEKEQAPL